MSVGFGLYDGEPPPPVLPRLAALEDQQAQQTNALAGGSLLCWSSYSTTSTDGWSPRTSSERGFLTLDLPPLDRQTVLITLGNAEVGALAGSKAALYLRRTVDGSAPTIESELVRALPLSGVTPSVSHAPAWTVFHQVDTDPSVGQKLLFSYGAQQGATDVAVYGAQAIYAWAVRLGPIVAASGNAL